MDKPLEYHTGTLLAVAECLETNKRDWAKRVLLQRRKDLVAFIDDPAAEVDEPFMDIFNRIVASLGSKITFKLFELVLKIGVNFATPENDAYWFALFKCNDYGAVFDQPEICELLIDEALLANSNSWKAACLLCILIQEYNTAKGIVVRLLSKEISRVFNLFQNIGDYAVCCYMTELLSQLNAPEFVSQIFPNHLRAKIIDGMYANDPLCMKFLDQFKQSNTIHHISSFSIEGVVQCGPSMCQLYPYFFVVLVNNNEYTAPIQFEFSEISSVQNNNRKARFHLGQQPTKTLLSVDIPPLSVVDLEFSTAQVARSIVEALTKVTKHTMMSTPRKISVVQDYIKVTSKIYEEADESSSLSDAILSESSPEKAEKQDAPASHDATTRTRHSSSDDSFIPEGNSLFGSPTINNTTKDTSASRHGRAISVAIADFSKKKTLTAEPVSQTKPSDGVLSSNIPLVEVPDSMDAALSALNKANNVKEDPPSPSKSAHPSNNAASARVVNKKTVKAPPAPIDIWDFDDSDPDKTLRDFTTEPKTMKFLKKGISKTNQNTAATKKTAMQKKLENADMVPEVPTKDIIVHSNDSNLLMSESFSGLTSPLASRNERGVSKVTNKRGIDGRLNDENFIGDSELPLAQKKRKTRSMSDDEPYKPSQASLTVSPAPEKRQTIKTKKYQRTPNAPERTTRSARVRLQMLEEVEENTENTIANEPKKAPPPPQKARPQPKKPAPPKVIAQPPKKAVTKIGAINTIAEGTRSTIEKTRHGMQPPPEITAPAPQTQPTLQEHQQLIANLTPPDLLNANMLLSEAYTNTLQRQIYESINAFSNQLVKKIQIINDEINKKVMTDLANKYDSLFNDLRGSFQKDVDEMCGFIGDVKGLLNLPEKQLVDYIKQKKFGQINNATDEES